MALSLDQKMHNIEVDQQIALSKMEHEMYVAECNAKREQFKKDNPNHPFADSMFLAVCAPKQVCAIYYVE